MLEKSEGADASASSAAESWSPVSVETSASGSIASTAARSRTSSRSRRNSSGPVTNSTRPSGVGEVAVIVDHDAIEASQNQTQPDQAQPAQPRVTTPNFWSRTTTAISPS